MVPHRSTAVAHSAFKIMLRLLVLLATIAIAVCAFPILCVIGAANESGRAG